MADATGIVKLRKKLCPQVAGDGDQEQCLRWTEADRGVGAGREIRGGTQSGRQEQRSRPKTPGFLAAAHVFIALFSLSSAFHACLR